MSTPLIAVKAATRDYVTQSSVDWLTLLKKPQATYTAVRGIDLNIQQGEVFALLGTNGAGKTSLVEMIEGLTKPTTGSIRVLGYDPYRQRHKIIHRLGIVLQESGFPADLTVHEMAFMWADTLDATQEVSHVLRNVELLHKADTAISSLSGGERRRLDLALALLNKPDVLFLDEPTTGLDPESRRRVWNLLRNAVNDGCTIVLTTHYLEEAEVLADRIAIMHQGKIVRQGTLGQIIADAAATITFDSPALPLDTLTLSHGSVSTAEQRVFIRTHDLQNSLGELLHWAGTNKIENLQARSASLEQVFLAIADHDSSGVSTS